MSWRRAERLCRGTSRIDLDGDAMPLKVKADKKTKISLSSRGAKIVKSNVLFTGLKGPVLNKLLTKFSERSYESGSLIFQDGSSGNEIFMILRGRVKIWKTTKYGGETVLAILHEGDFFGELEVIDGLPRSASAAAIDETTLAVLPRADVDALLRQHPQAASNLLHSLSNRLRTVDETLILELERHTDDTSRQLDRLHTLIEATKKVNSTIEIDKLLGVILETARKSVNADRGTVYLIDDLKGDLWSKVAQGADMVDIHLPIGKGLAGSVAQSGEVINLVNAYEDSRFNPEIDRETGYHTESMLTMPMKDKDGKIVGVFQMLNKVTGATFTEEDVEFLDALSAGASIAIQNAKMAQEIVKSERLSSIGQMASAIIHDIKNPMNTIRVYAQVMKKKSGNEEAVKLADEMIRQVDRLVNMLQEILDFSRGLSATHFEEIPLGDVMEAILGFIEKDLVKHKVELVLDLRYTGPVVMDSDKMTRVFYNVASNARDAMPNGGKLTVRTDLRNSKVYFEFTDTGTGMPEEIKRRIFEPFVSHGKKHGTGLGMAIVKKVLDDHNGRIEIDSELGKGTTMRFIIPVKLQP